MGCRTQRRVTASSGLSEEQVEQLVSEAEAHAQSDQNRRTLIDMRNKADGLIYSTERTLEEFAANIDPGDSEEIRKAVEKAKELCAGEDLDALRSAVDELSTVTYQMTEKLYAALGGDSED